MSDIDDDLESNVVATLSPDTVAQTLGVEPVPPPQEHTHVKDVAPPLAAAEADGEGGSADPLSKLLSMTEEDSAQGHIPKRTSEESETLAHQRRKATRAELDTAVNSLVAQRNNMRRLVSLEDQRRCAVAENKIRHHMVEQVARLKKQSKGSEVLGLPLPFLFLMDLFEGVLEDVMKTLVDGHIFSYDDFPIFLEAAYLRAYTQNMKGVLDEKQRAAVESGQATVGTQEVPVNFKAGLEERPIFKPSASNKVFQISDFLKKK